jgi:hypothetical protein
MSFRAGPSAKVEPSAGSIEPAPASRRPALRELLPQGTPEDWVAIGSAPLFDEYERKLREVGRKLDPAFAK